MNVICKLHGTVNYKICTRCPPKEYNATQLQISVFEKSTPGFTKPEVIDTTSSNIYLQEVVTILTKNGEQKDALIMYDTAGGLSLFSSKNPNNKQYNHFGDEYLSPTILTSSLDTTTTRRYNIDMILLKMEN